MRKEIARRRGDRMQPDARRTKISARREREQGGDFDRIPVLRETISCANRTTTRAPSLIKHTCVQPRYLLA